MNIPHVLTSKAKQKTPEYRNFLYPKTKSNETTIQKIASPVPDVVDPLNAQKIIDSRGDDELKDFSKNHLNKPPSPTKPLNLQETIAREKEKRKYQLRKKIMLSLHAMSMPTHRFVSKFCAKIGKIGVGAESEFIDVYPQHFLDTMKIQEREDVGDKIEFSSIVKSIVKLTDATEAQLYTTLFMILQNVSAASEELTDDQTKTTVKLAQNLLAATNNRMQTEVVKEWLQELSISNTMMNLTVSDLYPVAGDGDSFEYLLMTPTFKALIENTRDDINLKCQKNFTARELMFAREIDSKFAEMMAIHYTGVLSGKASTHQYQGRGTMSGGNGGGGAYYNRRSNSSSMQINYVQPPTGPTRYQIAEGDREYVGLLLFFKNVFRSHNLNDKLTYISPTNSDVTFTEKSFLRLSLSNDGSRGLTQNVKFN